MMPATSAVLSKLGPVKRNGVGWKARCPAHDDRAPSLSIAESDGKVLVRCMAGCDTQAVLDAAGLAMSDLFEPKAPQPAEIVWPIRDKAGKVQAIHTRYGIPKRYKWTLPDGRVGLNGTPSADLPLYGIDRLAPDGAVVVTEGEKDADALHRAGIPAVATVTGSSGTPSAAVLADLAGRDVILWPDNDDGGRAHMRRIAGRLAGVAASVRVVSWPDAPKAGAGADDYRGDYHDLLDAADEPPVIDGTPDELVPATPTDDLGLLTVGAVAPVRLEWLWPGYIPAAKVSILDGDPGLGKSTMLVDLAARLSRGLPSPSGDPFAVSDTLLVTSEDDPADTIRPRLDAAGADPWRVHVMTRLSLPGDLDRLAQAIERTRAKLVVIDPLVAYLDERVKTNDDHAVRRALEPLAAIAERHHCAIVGIRHLNKDVGKDALYRGGGTIGFTGLARAVLGVARDPEDDERVILFSIKINVARRPPSLAYRLVAPGPYDAAHVEWDGETRHTAEGLIGRDIDATRALSKTDSLAEAMRAIVAANDGRMLSVDLYRALEADGWELSSQDMKMKARDRAGLISEKAGGLIGQWYVALRPES